MNEWQLRFITVVWVFIIAVHPAPVSALEPVSEFDEPSESAPAIVEKSRLEEQTQEDDSKRDLVDGILYGAGEVLKGVERHHQTLSDQIVGFTEKIDTFFISDDQERRINYSHIQLGYRYTRYKNNSYLLDPIFDARIHLPRTENKLTLEISNNSPLDSASETTTSSAASATGATGGTIPAEQSQAEQAFNVGLGYAREISELLSAKVTTGGKLAGTQMNFYMNLQLYRKFFFNKWSLHLSEDLYRDRIIHTRSTAQILFERNISEDKLFRSISKNIYFYDKEYGQNHQTFYVLHQLSERDAMIYQIGGMWEKPLEILDYNLEGYYSLVRYSRKIHKNWLFMEISPQVHFLRSENFHPEPLLVLQLSAFFGNNK